MKRVLTTAILISVIGLQSIAQENGSPAVMPLEARIGLHRTVIPAAFVTLRNTHPHLSIRSVVLGVSVTDPIKLVVLKHHVHRFTFANAIKPREAGEAVVTSGEGFTVKKVELASAQCKAYKADTNDLTRFTPNDCIKGQDILTLTVYAVEYTDGSKWIAPTMKRGA